MKEFFRQALYVPFYNLLIFFAWVFGGSVGWAIVAVTVIIRTILLPSSLKATKAQVKMQALAPKMAELKETHKGDQKKLNEETMKMYKEEGANPLGSCLPLLIQLPIIWILYRVFLIGFDESKFEMLYAFVPRPEVLKTIFFGVDLSVPNLWVMPIIAGALQFGLSYMMMAKTPKPKDGKKGDPAQMMTKQMTYIFPIITVFIARSLPAALALYWIITTVFSIVQQVYVNKTIKSEENLKKAKEVIGTKKIETKEVERAKDEVSAKDEKKKKNSDMMTKVLRKRQEKKEKKAGVSVTIRQKK